MERLVYLDHAATTPLRPSVLDAMLPFLTTRFANPSGSHRFARDARRAVDEARDVVAAAIGCRPGEVVFTSCGTESDSTAIRGALTAERPVAVCPATEHHAVLHVVEETGGRVVATDGSGRVDLDALADALDDQVGVVGAMAANNEVGTITDLGAVSALVRSRAPGALVHTDAVQAPCWLDLREVWPHVDTLAMSAHKFGGPKGVGVLAWREGATVAPLLVGGGQERERRSGTHNVAGIVGLAAALAAADAERSDVVARVGLLRERLVSGLTARLDDVRETVPADRKVVGSAHLMFAGVENEALLYLLDEAGVCASAASACASGAMEPSHVLAAMGVEREWAQGALRLTLGSTTTDEDVEQAIDAVAGAVERIRERAR